MQPVSFEWSHQHLQHMERVKKLSEIEKLEPHTNLAVAGSSQ